MSDSRVLPCTVCGAYWELIEIGPGRRVDPLKYVCPDCLVPKK